MNKRMYPKKKQFDWRKEIQDQLGDQFLGTKIEWKNENDFNLVIPDDQIGNQEAIIQFLKALWEEAGGEVELYPERAVIS